MTVSDLENRSWICIESSVQKKWLRQFVVCLFVWTINEVEVTLQLSCALLLSTCCLDRAFAGLILLT